MTEDEIVREASEIVAECGDCVGPRPAPCSLRGDICECLDVAEKVIAFYKAALTKAGYEITRKGETQ